MISALVLNRLETNPAVTIVTAVCMVHGGNIEDKIEPQINFQVCNNHPVNFHQWPRHIVDQTERRVFE